MKRYDLGQRPFSDDIEMLEDRAGDYVLHSDASAEIAILKAGLQTMTALNEYHVSII